MPDTVSTSNKNAPALTVEQLSEQTRLPEGHAKSEQRRLSENNYKLHSERQQERQHQRRETQEERLIEHGQLASSQNASPAAAASAAVKLKAINAQRSREQSDQLAQSEEISPKGSKRGRSKKGESHATVQNLSSIVGEECAEQIAQAIDETARKSGSGLTINPSELKHLSEEIAVTLRSATASDRSIVEKLPALSSDGLPELLCSSVLSRLTGHTGSRTGAIYPDTLERAVLDVLSNESAGTSSTSVSALEIELTQKVADILNRSDKPIQDLHALHANLSRAERRVLSHAIVRYEATHERFALDALLERMPSHPVHAAEATDLFLATCIPESRRQAYSESYLAHCARKFEEFSASAHKARDVKQLAINEVTREFDELRNQTLKLIEQASQFSELPLCSSTTLSHYKECSHQELQTAHVTITSELNDSLRALLKERFPHPSHPSHGALLRHLSDLERYRSSGEALHFRLSTLLSELDAIAIGLTQRQSELLKKTERLRELLTPRNRQVVPYNFDDHNRTSSTATDSHNTPSSSPHHSGGEAGDEKTEVRHGFSQSEQNPAREESAFELRQEADRERSISVDNARNYALAGDFANAEAIITSYNNRFPQFQVSRDFISEIRNRLREAQE